LKGNPSPIQALVARRAKRLWDRAQGEIEALAQGYRPDRILLFGSLAREDVHVGSDVDLLIVKNEAEERFADRIAAALDCCSGTVGVQGFVYTEEEIQRMLQRGNEFIANALREGVLVYEKPKPSGG